MNIRIVILTEKLKKFIELEEEKGTIRYRKPRPDPEKEKGSRFRIAPNFAYPACYDERPMSADGRVAFHFKHTFVVKRLVSAPDGGGQGRETRLVVTGDKDASRAVKVKGQSASAAGYEAYISNPDAVMSITAPKFDQYMVSGNLETDNGAVFTNIHADVEKREAFWEAVERIERKPSADVVTIYPGRLSAGGWRALREGFSGPEEARDALLQAAVACERSQGKGTKRDLPVIKVELEAREFTKLRKLLRDAHMLDRDEPAITIKRGRGGRVQRRMVAEFPKGLDATARVRIAVKFAGYLAEKKVMYTVVIHAPNAYNHVDNYHLHAVAYDRPCKFLEEHGCWDFEYEVKDKWGRPSYPERQDKIGELTRPSDGKNYRDHGARIITEMRRAWEEFCNEELREAGINRLFDHRSYKAMGIEQEPTRHLGTRAAALEAIGVPTFVGIENAEKSYTGALKRIHQAHDNRKRVRADCRDEASAILSQGASHQAVFPQLQILNELVGELKSLEAELGDQERDLALWALWLKMANSRAEDTISRCQPILDAIEDGAAKAADVRNEEALRARVQAAEQYLAGIRDEIAEDVEKVAIASADVAAKVSSVDRLLGEIQSLTDELTDKLATLPQRQSEPEGRDGAPPAGDTHAPRQDRRSRQLQEYFEAPLDYEEEWDRVFHRIELEELEILPPNARGPVYRVPGIAKDDFDRLTNPIFRKRSQARLKAMYQVQEWNRERAARAIERHVVTEEPGRERDAKYDTLLEEAKGKAAAEREKAIKDWFAHLDATACRLPVRFCRDAVRLDVEAVPANLRKFAELMGESLKPGFTERAEIVRQEVAAALAENPMAVDPTPTGFKFYLDRFPEKLRVNVAMFLRHDGATRNAARSVAHSRSSSTAGHAAPGAAAALSPPRAPVAPQRQHASVSSAQAPFQSTPATPSSGLTNEQIEFWKRKSGIER